MITPYNFISKTTPTQVSGKSIPKSCNPDVISRRFFTQTGELARSRYDAVKRIIALTYLKLLNQRDKPNETEDFKLKAQALNQVQLKLNEITECYFSESTDYSLLDMVEFCLEPISAITQANMGAGELAKNQFNKEKIKWYFNHHPQKKGVKIGVKKNGLTRETSSKNSPKVSEYHPASKLHILTSKWGCKHE
jgi:hypothetical protein